MPKLRLVAIVTAIILVISLGGLVGCQTTTAETTAAATVAETTAAATVAETTAAETAAVTVAEGEVLKFWVEGADGRKEMSIPIPKPEDIKPIKYASGSIGNRTDGSWCQGIYNGYLAIKGKYPQVEITFTDAIPFGDFPTWLNLQAESGASLFYLDSAQTWQEALQEVSPNTVGKCNYFTPGTSYSEITQLAENVAGMERAQWETAFLCGIAAGMVTKSNTIGFVGGVDYPELIRKLSAWEIGAKVVNPDIKSVFAWIGSWIDIGKGYETTVAVINEGADVIMEHADDSGKGVMQACTDNKVYAVGFASDRLPESPDYVITTALVDHEQLMEYALWINDAGIAEQVSYQFTIKEGWRGISPFTNVSQDVTDMVNKYKQMIIDGTIVIPNLPEVENLGTLNPADYGIPTEY